MTTITKCLQTMALVAGTASLAQADTALDFAVAHFNQSADRHSDIVTLPERTRTGSLQVQTSAMDGSPMGDVIRRLNETADTPGERRGVHGVTTFNGGHSARAAEIFRRLAEEDDG
ncbi:hypothetical protein [Gymnodinialimonas ceratoperidinii]|uniref:Uncharacterized protein n=1 Tax=Gymnodinialimonas ceratoperidinii TaxID=2856823 RepID=A0A8F6Y9K9_9RHOB|nr:hypothetical protein [Gymnodinialimonas ceratoperidinii]QXT39054.1 hypothetical protein KYE46_14110 [Gymnodinialimonas ceratoperidinii]